MNLEGEIERIKQSKSLKHVKLDNEFNDCNDLFVDKIDDEQDVEEWSHCREKFKYNLNDETYKVVHIKEHLYIKNIQLEIKYKEFDEKVIINGFRNIYIDIVKDKFYVIWNSSLYINNLIADLIGIKNNCYKIPLVCLMKHKILNTLKINIGIHVRVFKINYKNIKLYVHYDFKKNCSDKKFMSNDKYGSNDKNNFILKVSLYSELFSNFIHFYNYYTKPHFIILTILNEEFNENIEKITFNLIVDYSEKINLYNNVKIENLFLALENKSIKVIIPEEEIITYKFMDRTFYIFGLDKQFTGIKSIKKILCSKQYYGEDNVEFLTIMKDIQFFPPISNLKNVSFYCF